MRRIIFAFALAIFITGCGGFKGISIDSGDFEDESLSAKAVSVFQRVASEKTGSDSFAKVQDNGNNRHEDLYNAIFGSDKE